APRRSGSSVCSTVPQNPPTPVGSARPNPHRAAVSGRSGTASRSIDSLTKVVLQEYANASRKERVPRATSPSFRKARWKGIVYVPGQATWAAGSRPALNRAAAVTTLKVEPGGKVSLKAL